MSMKWIYKNKEFDSNDIPGTAVGFVYLLTNTINGLKYIGKKNFYSTRRLPPLKGKSRKRIVTKESDWKTYMGSSPAVDADIELYGVEKFHKEILEIAYGKGELSYLEVKHQIYQEVLLDNRFYNGIIQCKIHKSHVKNL